MCENRLQLVAVLGHSGNNSDKLIHTKTCLHFSHTFYDSINIVTIDVLLVQCLVVEPV